MHLQPNEEGSKEIHKTLIYTYIYFSSRTHLLFPSDDEHNKL